MQTPSTFSAIKSGLGFSGKRSNATMFRPLIRFALAHYRTFIDGFDPVRSLSSHSHLRHQISPAEFQPQPNFHVRSKQAPYVSTTTSTFNLHFAIPFFTVLYATAQGLLGFDFFYNLSIVDITSADFVPHQIFPKQMWAQSDLVLGASTVNMLFIYFNLMRRPMLPIRFHMFYHYYPKIQTDQQQQENNSKVPFSQHQPVLMGADHGSVN